MVTRKSNEEAIAREGLKPEEREALERLRRIYPIGREQHKEVYGRDGAGGRFDEERDRGDISLAMIRIFPADDAEPVTHDELCEAFANSAVTVSQRSGQPGVCLDSWIPVSTRGQLRAIAALLPERKDS